LPLLSALADGEATAAELAELRPHLRSCPACRATLRECHAMPSSVAALVPPALVGLAVAAPHGSLADHAALALHALAERATLLAGRAQAMFDAAPTAKLAAVAASTAALAGGGVVLEQATQAPAAPQRVAAVAPGHIGLAPIAFPSSRGSGARRMSHAVRGEFASAPSGPSEFTPHAAPTAEFASASTSASGGSPRASAAGAGPSPPPSRPSHSSA